MQIRMAERTIAPVMLAVFMFARPCFAQGHLSDGGLGTSIIVSGDTVASDQSTMAGSTTVTGGGAATSGNGAADWERSATETARNIEIATEKAYEHMKQNASDFSLSTKVQAVLHENKYTRSSDVHATANN